MHYTDRRFAVGHRLVLRLYSVSERDNLRAGIVLRLGEAALH